MKRKIILFFVLTVSLLVGTAILILYRILFGLSIHTEKAVSNIYVPSGATFEQVLDSLDANLSIKNLKTLKWLAIKKNYPDLIKPGRYVVDKDQSYNGLVNLLRSGRQTPVKVTFNNIRTLEQLAGKIGKTIEADSSEIISFLSDDTNYVEDGFRREDIISLFIPDTYEFYWATDAGELYKRMLKEYKSFWNEERLSRAKEMKLSQKEVAILASIIDDEVVKKDEKPRIAGVYLNRVRLGMPLQACPTIKFAMNDFTITRVLNEHLKIESPYNTYKYRGFPPGPIGCPSVEGIDAVLNAEKHDYIFFAAKADFSGYHNFSRTLSEHNRYAAQYQKELNKRKIFR